MSALSLLISAASPGSSADWSSITGRLITSRPRAAKWDAAILDQRARLSGLSSPAAVGR
jgi:hypothetical protein